MDLRKEINRAARRTKRSKYWIAKKAGLRMATVYKYLNGKNDMTGENIGKLLDAIGLEIRPKD